MEEDGAIVRERWKLWIHVIRGGNIERTHFTLSQEPNMMHAQYIFTQPYCFRCVELSYVADLWQRHWMWIACGFQNSDRATSAVLQLTAFQASILCTWMLQAGKPTSWPVDVSIFQYFFSVCIILFCFFCPFVFSFCIILQKFLQFSISICSVLFFFAWLMLLNACNTLARFASVASFYQSVHFLLLNYCLNCFFVCSSLWSTAKECFSDSGFSVCI